MFSLFTRTIIYVIGTAIGAIYHECAATLTNIMARVPCSFETEKKLKMTKYKRAGALRYYSDYGRARSVFNPKIITAGVAILQRTKSRKCALKISNRNYRIMQKKNKKNTDNYNLFEI